MSKKQLEKKAALALDRVNNLKEKAADTKKLAKNKKQVLKIGKAINLSQLSKIMGISRGHLYNKLAGVRPLDDGDQAGIRAYLKVLKEYIEELEKNIPVNNSKIEDRYKEIKQAFESHNA